MGYRSKLTCGDNRAEREVAARERGGSRRAARTAQPEMLDRIGRTNDLMSGTSNDNG
ncbi:hypothetical protein [Methanoculleus sp.]|uniref:hypothetical protein n=1 Tax=Methanoculleus sp. TaxID=90427 RepID=UPI0025E7B043|nr:hypothetical protein [Methanoculleus sp.]MCK9317054.1 hypothetical protein [Methanoculleus sp.]